MNRYAHHGRPQHTAMKLVARLKHRKDCAVGMLGGFGAVHSLVEVRVERLAQRVNPMRAELRQIVQKLLVDQLKALAIALVLGFAMRGQGVLETIQHRDQSLDDTRRDAPSVFAALPLDALAVVLRSE